METHRSRPAWGAWIETQSAESVHGQRQSRPAWGAWIETTEQDIMNEVIWVAPRMGRVD